MTMITKSENPWAVKRTTDCASVKYDDDEDFDDGDWW